MRTDWRKWWFVVCGVEVLNVFGWTGSQITF